MDVRIWMFADVKWVGFLPPQKLVSDEAKTFYIILTRRPLVVVDVDVVVEL
jgi:hypothetical protein